MIEQMAEPHRWPTSRWGVFVTLIFTGQLGLIFWLGKSDPLPAPPTDFPPSIGLAAPGAADVLEFSDPTLLALPHRQNFSGPAWLSIGEQDPGSVAEAPPSLALAHEQLGADLQSYMKMNRPTDAPLFDKPDFRLRQPLVAKVEPLSAASTLRVTGDLARRKLINPPTLPSWPSADILTNTVVEVLVAADGKPISATLHVSASGPSEADRYALREVHKARFEPLLVTNPADPMEQLISGQFVFEWHTVPLMVTNNAAQTEGER